MIDETSVRAALATVKYPGFSRDILSFHIVSGVVIGPDSGVVVTLSLATRDPEIPRKIHDDVIRALTALPGIGSVKLNFDIKEPSVAAARGPGEGSMSEIKGVRQIIAVASGKGGVGKSTVSANLAVALAQQGVRVGLCDCDLYGPSIAHMFGTDERPLVNDSEQIMPVHRFGVKLMSMGFLLEDDAPVIVRGPLATRYVQQFLRQVNWGDLDVLILDLPPGTGDIQLTIVQTVALTGALIVTTPQEVALIDARKAASMFAKVNVPVLGLVENMSAFLCPGDGKLYPIFGEGGGVKEALRLGVSLLAQIPLDIAAREGGDEGRPVALQPASESLMSAIFQSLATSVRADLMVKL